MESSSRLWHPIVAAATASTNTFAPIDWLLVVLLLAALLLAATSAAAETALTSVNRIKIRTKAEEGDVSAQRILRLLEKPQSFLSTILVVSNVSIIIATTVATILAISIFANFGEVISTVVLSLFVLIFCEITPKTIAVQAPETWAKRLAPPVEAASAVLRPIIIALTWVTNGLVQLVGGQTLRHGPFVTEEELRMLVEVGEEEGILEEDEREMIHNVFELADTTVREIMVPRIDMVTIEGDASVEEAMDVINQGGQSRIPVYDGSLDNVIGVLYAKDLLRAFRTTQHPKEVRNLVRRAYFVPESKHLDDLLRELQQQHVHIAIVVDEYGSVSGLVTIEDLVEEIIGDIQDEYDREEQIIERISDDEYLVNAKISLDELNEELDTQLTSEDYDTLGGLVYGQLDKIPTVGDTISAGGFTITVMSTKGRRVTKVRLVRQHTGNGDQSNPHEDTHLQRQSVITPAPPDTLAPSDTSLPLLSAPEHPQQTPPRAPETSEDREEPAAFDASADYGLAEEQQNGLQQLQRQTVGENASQPVRSRHADPRRSHNHHASPRRRI